MDRHMLSLCAVLIIAACAGTTVQRVPDSKNAEIDGIRYYQSAPFLLVFSNGKGNITSQLVYLPDTTRMMALDPYAFAASNDSTFKFTNGLLQEATTVVDETLVPKAIVTALVQRSRQKIHPCLAAHAALARFRRCHGATRVNLLNASVH